MGELERLGLVKKSEEKVGTVISFTELGQFIFNNFDAYNKEGNIIIDKKMIDEARNELKKQGINPDNIHKKKEGEREDPRTFLSNAFGSFR